MSALATALLGSGLGMGLGTQLGMEPGMGLGMGGPGLADLQTLFNPQGGIVSSDPGDFTSYGGTTEGTGLQISPDTGETPMGLPQETGIYEPGLDVATNATPMDIATDIAIDTGLVNTPTELPIIGGTNIETGSTTPVGGNIDLSELFGNLGGGFNPNISHLGGALPFGAISKNAGPAAVSIPHSGFYEPRQLPVHTSAVFGVEDPLSTSLL